MTADDNYEADDYRRRWAVEAAIAMRPKGAKVEGVLADARRLEAFAAGRKKKAKIILINNEKEKANDQ